MDPVSAATAAAGLSGIASAGINYFSARDANAANARIAAENRDFQRDMSNTASQRHVADLRAAGLNPILGYSSQASTPSGAQHTHQNEASAALASALDLYRSYAEIRKINADTNLQSVQAKNLGFDSHKKEFDSHKYSYGNSALHRLESLLNSNFVNNIGSTAKFLGNSFRKSLRYQHFGH